LGTKRGLNNRGCGITTRAQRVANPKGGALPKGQMEDFGRIIFPKENLPWVAYFD